MARPTISAVIPVKPFGQAKRRLAPLLSKGELAELGRAMLEDVLSVLATIDGLGPTLIVTNDPEAGEIGLRFGARVVGEGGNSGLNPAVARAADLLRSEGADGMIVVPGDIPHLAPATLHRCLGHLTPPRSAVLVPATADGGTNLLAMRPVDLIAPSFGPDSFLRHRGAAHAAGVEPLVLTPSEAERDIDRPDDLAHVFALGTSTRTHRFLSRIGLGERLASGRAPPGATHRSVEARQ